jgi:hypothetical protein
MNLTTQLSISPLTKHTLNPSCSPALTASSNSLRSRTSRITIPGLFIDEALRRTAPHTPAHHRTSYPAALNRGLAIKGFRALYNVALIRLKLT